MSRLSIPSSLEALSTHAPRVPCGSARSPVTRARGYLYEGNREPDILCARSEGLYIVGELGSNAWGPPYCHCG